jgi:hypothetical protein
MLHIFYSESHHAESHQAGCHYDGYRYSGCPGVNFTNILRAAFSHKIFLRSFYVLTILVCNFWRKDFGTKAAHKMLVKLTPGAIIKAQKCL